MSFKVGDIFANYEEFKDKLKDYQDEKFVILSVLDSTTVERARKKQPKRTFSDSLCYSYLKLGCTHYGEFRGRGTGHRMTKSAKISCPASITVGCSADGQQLVVRQLNEDHSHVIVPEAYRHYHKNRTLDDTAKASASLMLKLGANATQVRHHFMQQTQKVITQQDIQNIRKASQARSRTESDDVQQIISMLQAADNASVRIVAGEDGTVQSVFYQSAFMRQMFESFSETLIFDATYKINNRNMPLFLPLVVDSAGYSQVVAVIITIDETADTLRAALSQFDQLNTKCSDVKSLIVDKDMSSISVLQSQFPNAAVNLCLFHCLRSFRREITESRMRITTAQKTVVLELLSKLSYANSETQYNQLYNELLDLNLATVTDYYDTNWHSCRQSWVSCFRNTVLNMGISGTQRIESLHQKVKQVVKHNSEIVKFFENLLVFLAAHQKESEHRVLDSLIRVPVRRQHDVLVAYSHELTEHAYSLVKQQHLSSVNVVLEEDGAHSHEGLLKVDTTSCECQFFKTTSLPCRHIMKFRQSVGSPLYDAALIPQRWQRAYWLSTYNTAVRQTTPGHQLRRNGSVDVVV